MSDTILQEMKSNGMLILTMNRPDAMNCMNMEMITKLKQVVEESNFDLSIRVIIITGAPPLAGKKASFYRGSKYRSPFFAFDFKDTIG